VTNEQYKLFIDANPGVVVPKDWDKETRQYLPGKDNHPVTYISFNDATAFCKWGGYRLSNKLDVGKGYLLFCKLATSHLLDPFYVSFIISLKLTFCLDQFLGRRSRLCRQINNNSINFRIIIH